MRTWILKTMLKNTPITERRDLLKSAFTEVEVGVLIKELIGPEYHICAMPKTRGVKRGKYKPSMKSLSEDYEATAALPPYTNQEYTGSGKGKEDSDASGD